MDPVDVIIVGAGVAGLSAARDCIQNGLSYVILEANCSDWIGGRIHTEIIDLSPYQFQTPPPQTYKFEHGAAWIHGTSGSKTLELFDELSSNSKQPFSQTQLSMMFEGCAWTNPEFIPPNFIVLYDPVKNRNLTNVEYISFLIIATFHLRDILRTYPDLAFSDFAQIYVDWVESSLMSPDFAIFQNFRESAGVIARAIGWYFHSIESYNGISIGKMSAQDVFHHYVDRNFPKQTTISDILNATSQSSLFHTLQLNLPQSFDDETVGAVVDRIVTDYNNSIYLPLDSNLQGCYPGDHSTTRTGMSNLVHLLVKDIEQTSNSPINIMFKTCVKTVDTATPLTQGNQLIRTIVTAVDDNGVNHEFKATKGVIVTASLNSILNHIQFISPDDPSDLNREDQDEQSLNLQEMVDDLHGCTDFVYYKKVMFCFPVCWWNNAETVRLVATLQQFTNMTHRCDHNWICSNQHAEVHHDLHNDRDFSEGGYSCIIAAATQVHQDNPFLFSTPEQHGMTSDEFQMNTVMYGVNKLSKQQFCHVNMILESHFTNKQTPVLSASLVGHFAKILCGVPDHIVQTIVLASLQSMYGSSTISTPVFGRVTQWAETPSISQSYSLITDTKYDSTQRVTIGAKYGVFFAGESFDLDAAGSIHAALFSSERAVRHLVANTSTIVEDDFELLSPAL